MAEAFVELGAEGINHFTENHWESTYDKVRGRRKGNGKSDSGRKENRDYKYQLPSPERDRDIDSATRRDDSLERQSQASERVLKAYENEPDDPRRRVDPELERRRRDSARMAYQNGYAASNAPSRPRSQPPKGRYDDDGDSDYDERDGGRYRTSGRGYDDRDDRDYPYDREVVETERYRGPARPHDARRMDSYQSRDQYGAGAMAPYRRSQNDLTEVSKRPKSRSGRSDYYDRDDRDDRDRSYSRSRSRSRSRERGGGGDGWEGKLKDAFDPSMQGLGVGIAGAVVGGLAGREYGKKHKNRDILLGALVGGLAANAAENKWQQSRGKKRDEERSRSSMR